MADESNLQVTVYARFAKGDEVYVVGLEALGGPTNDPDLVAGNPDTDLYDEDDTGDLTATLHIPKSLVSFPFILLLTYSLLLLLHRSASSLIGAFTNSPLVRVCVWQATGDSTP
jgi:hypothetical protein